MRVPLYFLNGSGSFALLLATGVLPIAQSAPSFSLLAVPGLIGGVVYTSLTPVDE
jgi:hypothetical protein